MADIRNDGSAIPTHKGSFPDDHIFVRGDTCKKYIELSNVLPSDGLSDHDIVIATIQLMNSIVVS